MSFLASYYLPSSDRLLSPDTPFDRVLEQSSPLHMVYDYDLLADSLDPVEFGSRGVGLRRFHPLLPLREWPDDPAVSFTSSPRRRLAGPEVPRRSTVTIKDEGAHPTGTIRDRGTALALNHALALQRPTVVAPGWGDVGVSLGGLGRQRPCVPSW